MNKIIKNRLYTIGFILPIFVCMFVANITNNPHIFAMMCCLIGIDFALFLIFVIKHHNE